MKLRTAIAAAFAVALSCVQAFGQATILPPGETCFQATAGVNGMVGLLGTITGGSAYTNGTYGGVSLTSGSGSGATANITVSGGAVTAVIILNPGIQYVAGDILSATAATIGGTGSGFSVPVSSTSINSSLAGGTVGFFIPNTFSVKQTWQDAGETILNTNPVGLDQNGCAVIYGSGIYRQIVKDSLGNTVYDKLTASTSPAGIFWAGLAGGTGNAITVIDTSFASQDGATIQFLAKATNTGPVTIAISGGFPLPIVNDTTSGPAALSGGEITASNTPMITFDAVNQEFHLVNPAVSTAASGASASITPPQGYLNLLGATAGVIQANDVIGTATTFYSPFVGNTLPVWNGSTFRTITFSELTATLTAAGSPASTIQDQCVFSNNGVPTLVTGPSWTTVTAGAGNRGSGAGTAQITRLQGIWVNAVQITAYNGLSSYSIPANQCTIVGSIFVDATPGQVSAYINWGQSRKWGFWNFYNRQPIVLKAGDGTSSWTVSSVPFRAANGNSANSLTVFSGLPEEPYDFRYSQSGQIALAGGANTGSLTIGIGINSTTASGAVNDVFLVGPGAPSGTSYRKNLLSELFTPPVIGTNVITALELGGGSSTVETNFGTANNMVLSAQWRG